MIGTRIYASNGNACDVTIPEIIRYLGDDPGTRVIVTYVEGLRDPETFMAVAREVAAKKPILAMKAGRTAEGAKAAASHTGGLAKEDMATDLIFKKAGILSFRGRRGTDPGGRRLRHPADPQLATGSASSPTPAGRPSSPPTCWWAPAWNCRPFPIKPPKPFSRKASTRRPR